MHRAYRLLACLIGALLTGCGAPELEPLPPGATILAFGDSLTFGTGADAGHSYPDVLRELTGLSVVNAGIPGEISTLGRQRLPALLAEHRPALVVLVHGGNDTLRNISPSQTRTHLRAMLETIHASGAQAVMLGVPGRNLTLAAPNYYREVAHAAKVPIDLKTLPKLMRDRKVKSDHVHFNEHGYRLMADAVHDLLRNTGALP